MSDSKKFTRRTEDFLCEHCGYSVVGNGYTNHCPECLWSKHVDINPGDRAESCLGLMEPQSAFQKNGQWTIVHKCLDCGFVRNNKTVTEDSFDQLLILSAIDH